MRRYHLIEDKCGVELVDENLTPLADLYMDNISVSSLENEDQYRVVLTFLITKCGLTPIEAEDYLYEEKMAMLDDVAEIELLKKNTKGEK